MRLLELLARQGDKRYLVRGLVDGPDAVPDLAPTSEADMDLTGGILRALLSDQYRPIEDLDILQTFGCAATALCTNKKSSVAGAAEVEGNTSIVTEWCNAAA